MMQRRRLIAAAPLAACASLALTGCDQVRQLFGSGAQASFHNTDITGASYAQKLALPDAEGKPRSLEEFRGKVVFVFFGFTNCPDICPTTMAELAQVKKLLGDDGAKLQGVFVSLDPERDTPELLRNYAQAFDPSFVALRGSPEQTAAAAREFKIFYQKVPGKTPGSYTLDHSAGSFVFDQKGQVRLYVRYGSEPQKLAEDIRVLLKQA